MNYFAQRDIIDLSIYDEKGNHVLTMDYLQKSIYSASESTLTIYTEILSDVFLNFIYDKEEVQASDFDRALNNKKYDEYLVGSHDKPRHCKLIAKKHIRDESSGRDVEMIYHIPHAELIRGIDMTDDSLRVSKYKIKFAIKPFNDAGQKFKILIEKTNT